MPALRLSTDIVVQAPCDTKRYRPPATRSTVPLM
jgi:hypothetical protein